MNREEELNKQFPLEDGTTYIQNLDNTMCEYSGLPNTQSYGTNPQTQAEGAGVGGESLKENFIDSSPISLEASPNSLESPNEGRDIDFMYKWIQEKSGKKNPISQKRKPKTISEWEDEFDIGGNS